MIDNIKKLLNYDWKEVIASLKVTVTPLEVPEETKKAFKYGYIGICVFMAVISLLSLVQFFSAISSGYLYGNAIGGTLIKVLFILGIGIALDRLRNLGQFL